MFHAYAERELLRRAFYYTFSLQKELQQHRTHFLIIHGNYTPGQLSHALIIAAKCGHLKAVKLLVQKGADIHTQKNLPLCVAAGNGHLDVVKFLFHPAGAGFALCRAAEKGRANVVKWLFVATGIDWSDIVAITGRDAFRAAAANGHVEVVRLFLCHTSLHVSDTAVETAFHYAAGLGHVGVVEDLIRAGVDIHSLNDAALRWAATKGSLQVVESLVRAGANIHVGNNSALIGAVRKGNLPIVKYLVEKGADINAGSADGERALHWAARDGHLNVVIYLVQNGADINATNGSTGDALCRAARFGYFYIVEFLVKSGVDLKRNGTLALQWARQQRNSRIADYLVNALNA